jgi:hypothetical protein
VDGFGEPVPKVWKRENLEETQNLTRGASCGEVNPKLQQRCFVWIEASKFEADGVAANLGW